MNRGVTIAALTSAIVIAGISGCSTDKSATSDSGSSSAKSSASTTGGVRKAKVTIDGKDQKLQGTVSCTPTGSDVTITIGGSSRTVGAVLTDADPPVVKSVGLGNVNGVTLGYTAGTGQGNASATKAGNAYKIAGTATAVNMAKPKQGLNKPFEIDVTCP